MRRATNCKSLDYSTIKDYVFTLAKEIRGCDIPKLKKQLYKQ